MKKTNYLLAVVLAVTACVPVAMQTSADPEPSLRTPSQGSPSAQSRPEAQPQQTQDRQSTSDSSQVQGSGFGAFRAGVGRKLITPPVGQGIGMRGYSSRTQPFAGIHDPLYSRVIALDDGKQKALILSSELLSLKGPIYENLVRLIKQRTGIPAENMLLTATHTHSAPGSEARVQGVRESEAQKRALRAYYETFANQTLAAVDEALASLEPAKVGVGLGRANVNVNRVVREKNGYGLGANPSGPSDKTVWVMRVDGANGKPLAVLSNYAVHGTVMGNGNRMVSGDLPGATSRYVEKHYGGRLVSPWTSGAAGDQSPIHYHQSSFRPGRTPDDLGRILGSEVVRVADGIKTTSDVRIQGFIKEIRLPSKPKRRGPRGGPVPFRMSLFSLNEDIVICGMAAEVYSNLGERVRAIAPTQKAGIFTQTNGNTTGYIPDRAGFQRPGYEVKAAKVGPDAEEIIVGAFKDFFRKLQ